jgi:hypothetical protein
MGQSQLDLQQVQADEIKANVQGGCRTPFAIPEMDTRPHIEVMGWRLFTNKVVESPPPSEVG